MRTNQFLTCSAFTWPLEVHFDPHSAFDKALHSTPQPGIQGLARSQVTEADETNIQHGTKVDLQQGTEADLQKEMEKSITGLNCNMLCLDSVDEELKPGSFIFLVFDHGISSESFHQTIADAIDKQPPVIKVLHCNHEIGCNGSFFSDMDLYISKTEITTAPVLEFRRDDKISAVENNLQNHRHRL
ncbi:hypothetical protein NE237_022615 [Protea cynaroides]|uniref:Uncharacterized protein n=1 Tax=Protea cynaroides TaxID=273540 RepID=A0A9Q0HA05_9MAGN|nr:hypothetical protein NE237_022615 [Protea cynaroides]